MNTQALPQHSTSTQGKWFYSAASLSLLVLMFIGFQLFYLQGKAFPGRPLTPPIRTALIIHGCLMTTWMLLAVTQPLLVGTGRYRVHMKLGMIGVALAVGMVISGLHIGIEAARVNPPEVRVFGLAPRQFMAIPVGSILIFGVFVAIGVSNRRRPEVHRPMMLLASISVIGAAVGRITFLNALYAGTWFELVFSAFFMQLIFGAILFALKCVVFKSFDRWFAGGLAALTAACVIISLGARTFAWDQIATFLLR